jgi:nitroreductase
VEFGKLVLQRRSVRKYSDREVGDEQLKAIVDAMRWAPSWANVQPVRLLCVKDPEIKSAVCACVPDLNPAYKALVKAPVLLVFCSILKKSGYYKGVLSNRIGDYFMLDAGLAIENAILAAADRELGTCLIGVFDVDKLKQTLNIPEDIEPVALSPLGYPEGETKTPRRKEIDELLIIDKWPEA